MKLTAFFILATCLHVNATDGFGQKVTLSEREVHIEKIFTEIKKQTGFNFLYTSNILANTHRVTVKVTNALVTEVLDIVLAGQGLEYRVKGEDKLIIIKTKPQTKAIAEVGSPQGGPIDVSGKVTDGEGRALAGANVKVRGSSLGVTTDKDGRFSLKDIPENSVLEITYVGHEMKTFTVRGSGLVNIALDQKLSMLDETVVIAYGQTTRRFATGNIASVKASDIEKQPVQNPLLALQGRVPGVEVTQLSGMNGGGVTVRIQGRNSINSGLEPLVVIDGVPYPSSLSNSNLEQIVQGGSPLNYLNVSDIESIDVLKDADATSIYGSRAANGAILITTKKGKIGKSRVNINLQQGLGKVTRKVDMMNTSQYIEMRKEAFRNDGLIPSSNRSATGIYRYAPDLTIWDTTRYTDWQKTLLGGTASFTNIGASISGGTTGMQFLVGSSFNRRTTVFPGNFEDRSGNIHFNISSGSVNQKLKVQLAGNYMIDINKIPNYDFTAYAIGLEPNAPFLYNDDGTLNWALDSAGASTWMNPLGLLFNYDFINTTKSLLSNADLSYNLLPGLEIRSSFGYTNMQTSIYIPLKLESAPPDARPFTQRSASYGFRNMNSWIIEPQLVYKKSLGKGRFEGLLGCTFQQNASGVMTMEGKGYTSDLLMKTIINAPTRTINQDASTMYKYNALFARVSYVLNDKYIVNLTGRRDGSSRFGDKNKFHTFASAAVGWVFSGEKWLRNQIHFLSFGKLRASYGTTGNDQISDYNYIGTYNNLNVPIPYQNIIGFAASRIPNPYLQWEETRKLQAGIDLGFLNDRILLNATYAINRSSNQLIQYSLPSITGFSSITENFPATVQNTSWEISLNTTIIKKRNFSWNNSFNLTVPRNKLLKFPNIELTSYGSASSTTLVGQPLGLTRAYNYIGVDPATGLYQIANKDGNAIPVNGRPTFPDDYNVLISTLSKFYGGMQNSIAFKNFQLSFLVQFVRQKGKRQLYYYNENVAPGQFSNGNSNQPITVLDRWQKSGDVKEFSRYNTDGSLVLWPTSSDVLYNYQASFIRLKTVSLSWQLPTQWLQRLLLQNGKLYFQGQNLATVSKYAGLDPETQSSTTMPPLQIWTMGLQIEL